MYIYIYVSIYIYKYTYTHIHIYTCVGVYKAGGAGFWVCDSPVRLAYAKPKDVALGMSCLFMFV